MKTFLLLAFSVSIALAPVASAQEDQDAPKQPKNRGQAAQAARRQNPNAGQPRPAVQAPRSAVPAQRSAGQPPRSAVPPPRTPRNIPSASVQQAPRWQPPQVNQDAPRTVNPGNARVRANNGRNRVRPPEVEPRVNPPVTTEPPADTATNVQPGSTVPPRTRTGDARNRDGGNRGGRTGDNDGRNRDGQNRTGGDRNWQSGGSYNGNWAEARRQRHRGHHNRSWWRSRYSRISLFGGGYYYWDNGFWFPAYGYDPYYSRYSYDEPIYGYGDLEPGQVVANVQRELQELGYYRYAIDGLMGPATRAALSAFQRDNGLPITAAIDGPTLSTLGLR